MRFKPISLRCECGGCLPARITKVGFTAQQELVIRWWCPICKRRHDTVRSLRDCLHGLPATEDELEVCQANDMCASDVRFLHSLGVALPTDQSR